MWYASMIVKATMQGDTMPRLVASKYDLMHFVS